MSSGPSGARKAQVLVTGAQGFVGPHVVSALADHPRWTPLPAGRRVGAEGIALDLTDPASVERAVTDAAAVVHCAVAGEDVTVGGTRLLLAAAARAGVRRFVHLSSISVYGDATGVVDEDTPLASEPADDYARWKIAAEHACRAAAEDGLDVVLLRPTIIYGSGSRLWITSLADRIRSGRWGTFGEAGGGTCNPVHVRDVAAAVVAALDAGPEVAGRAYNIDGGDPVTWNGWFRRIADAVDVPLAPVSPTRLRARMAAGLPAKAVRRAVPGFSPGWLAGVPARSEVALFRRRAVYPATRAAAELGWQPAVDLRAGLDEALAPYAVRVD